MEFYSHCEFGKLSWKRHGIWYLLLMSSIRIGIQESNLREEKVKLKELEGSNAGIIQRNVRL